MQLEREGIFLEDTAWLVHTTWHKGAGSILSVPALESAASCSNPSYLIDTKHENKLGFSWQPAASYHLQLLSNWSLNPLVLLVKEEQEEA